MKTAMLRWSLFLLIGAGIGFAINLSMKQNELDEGVIPLSADDQGNATILKQPSETPAETLSTEGAESLGGAFSLTDQNGKTVTENDFTDTYKLIFFGFTHCPAVCPTELQKITQVMKDLGEDSNIFTPVFITLDPQRDTAERLKEYLADFHPKTIGLTGTAEQIDTVKQHFRVFSQIMKTEGMEENYMVDHSAFTYLTDKNNKVIAIYPSSDTSEKITVDIRKKNLQ